MSEFNENFVDAETWAYESNQFPENISERSYFHEGAHGTIEYLEIIKALRLTLRVVEGLLWYKGRKYFMKKWPPIRRVQTELVNGTTKTTSTSNAISKEWWMMKTLSGPMVTACLREETWRSQKAMKCLASLGIAFMVLKKSLSEAMWGSQSPSGFISVKDWGEARRFVVLRIPWSPYNR